MVEHFLQNQEPYFLFFATHRSHFKEVSFSLFFSLPFFYKELHTIDYLFSPRNGRSRGGNKSMCVCFFLMQQEMSRAHRAPHVVVCFKENQGRHHNPLPLPFLVGTKPTNTLGRTTHNPPRCCYLATTSLVVPPLSFNLQQWIQDANKSLL